MPSNFETGTISREAILNAEEANPYFEGEIPKRELTSDCAACGLMLIVGCQYCFWSPQRHRLVPPTDENGELRALEECALKYRKSPTVVRINALANVAESLANGKRNGRHYEE